jgi:uncharacterized protein (DUF362 family)
VLVKTRDRAAGVRKALALWGGNPVAGKTVALKANFNSSNPPPASTHPDTLRTLIQEIQAMGATSITLAERSGSADTRSVLNELGIFDLAEELGVSAVVLNDLKDQSNWELIQPPGSHWRSGYQFEDFHCAGAVIQTCCLSHIGRRDHPFFEECVEWLPGTWMIFQDYMSELHAGMIGTKVAETIMPTLPP